MERKAEMAMVAVMRVGDRTRRRWRAAEGEEVALGGVSHVGGSIHRASPRRLSSSSPSATLRSATLERERASGGWLARWRMDG